MLPNGFLFVSVRLHAVKQRLQNKNRKLFTNRKAMQFDWMYQRSVCGVRIFERGSGMIVCVLSKRSFHFLFLLISFKSEDKIKNLSIKCSTHCQIIVVDVPLAAYMNGASVNHLNRMLLCYAIVIHMCTMESQTIES